MSLNKSIVMGNLTRDPELKTFDGGGCVCNFSIASNYSYKPKGGGDRVDKVTFVECKANGPRGETIKKYFQKGKPIIVEGRLETQSWEDRQTGAKRSKLVLAVETFHFLPKTGEGNGASAAPAPQQSASPEPPQDDVPF